MKKSLGTILGAAIVGAGLLFAPVKKANADFYFFGNFEEGFEEDSSAAISVSSIPEQSGILVPMPSPVLNHHPCPIYMVNFLEGNAPQYIKADLITFKKGELDLYNSGFTSEARAGFGIESGNFDVKLGTGLKIGPDSILRDGTSYLGSDLPVSLFLRLSYNFLNPKEEKMTASLFADYAANFIGNLSIESGYSNCNVVYNLGDVLVHELKAGIHIPILFKDKNLGNLGPFLEIYGGANIPQIVNENPIGYDTGLNVKPDFNVGAKIGLEFDTL